MNAETQPAIVSQLIERSNRLGSDPGTRTSAGAILLPRESLMDPTSGERVEVMWVKGSGGDLGTLSAEGLAMLRLDGLRALKDVYRGEEHEDEMHQLLDYCIFGPPGSAPSIDTPMHGLLPALHVDHLHPDSVIAIAASIDGEELTKRCFGDEVAWVPWRRPGFELALEIDRLRDQQPGLKGVVLGGHGLTSWGDSSDACEANTLELIRRAAEFLDRNGRPEPLGLIRAGYRSPPPLRSDVDRLQSSLRSCAAWPAATELWSVAGSRMIWSSTSSAVRPLPGSSHWGRRVRTISSGPKFDLCCWTSSHPFRWNKEWNGCESFIMSIGRSIGRTTSGTPMINRLR